MKRFSAAIVVVISIAVVLSLSDLGIPFASTIASEKQHTLSAASAANELVDNDVQSVADSTDAADEVASLCKQSQSDSISQVTHDSVSSLKIGSDKYAIQLPTNLDEDLRDYIFEDLSRVLKRAVGAEIEANKASAGRAGSQNGSAQGRLRIKTKPGDFQAYAIADRLREAVDYDGCWVVVVPNSLIRRYREARNFWSERSAERRALQSFIETFKTLAAKDSLTRKELSVLTTDSSPLLENAESNPLTSIEILYPSPLAFDLVDRDGGRDPDLRTGVPFIRKDELGLLLLEFRNSRWTMIPFN